MADAYNFQTSHADFIPTIIAGQALLAATDATLNGCLSASQDVSAFMPAGGATLQVGIQSAVTLGAVTETTADEYGQFSASNKTLAIDDHYGVPIAVTNRLQALSNQDLLRNFVTQGLRNAMKNMDASLAAHYSLAGEVVAGVTSADITETEVRAAKKQLDEAKCPTGGRYLIVNPQQMDALSAIARFTEVDKIGSGQAIVDGMVGRIHGFNVFTSNNIVETTDGFAHLIAGYDGGGNPLEGSLQHAFANLAGIVNLSQTPTQIIGGIMLVKAVFDPKVRAEVLHLEQLYGTSAFRTEWLVEIKVRD